MSTSGHAPRCAALIGPYLSGKTSLLESLLFICGAIHKKGQAAGGHGGNGGGSMVGDHSAEARSHEMGVELNAATCDYLGDSWTFIDCPGSIEFAQESRDALMVADIAVVVCEPDVGKVIGLSPILKFLDEYEIPHVIFINKMDVSQASLSTMMAAIQNISERPLVMREIPIREGEEITGFVDLASERAYAYHDGAASDLISIPDAVEGREQEERQAMLETLADFDDDLLTELLEDVAPSTDEVFNNLTRDIAGDKVVPVFFGSAEKDQGVRRLMKSLRHDTPDPAETANRFSIASDGEVLATVFKNIHAPHTGKLSLARIWRGQIKDGMTLVAPKGSARVSGLYTMFGEEHRKLAQGDAGAVVALGRMEPVLTGDSLSPSGKGIAVTFPDPLSPLSFAAVSVGKSSDEVKLSESLHKLCEEDLSLAFEQNPDTHELVFMGQGEMHLKVAGERLKSKFNLDISMSKAKVPYKETITRPVSQKTRYKRQTGGHGQFGEVHLDIKPQARGAGFSFSDTVVGGRVPKQFIPAVETGVKEYITSGPLGFPIVDISVTLTDGSFHAVDSSEQSFKIAGRNAMNEALPGAGPVLLEPIHNVTISLPNEFTSKVQRLISSRRGQIMGFDAKDGWKNWDEVTILIPLSQMHDLIIELRSITHGVGSFKSSFDHLQELTGRLAEGVVAAGKGASD